VGTAAPEHPEAPHDHELEELEVDSSIPPRPEEEVADADGDEAPDAGGITGSG
jgi:hypothetical protein